MLGTLCRAMGPEGLCHMDDSGCLYPSYLHYHSVPGNGNSSESSLIYTAGAKQEKFPSLDLNN